MAQTEENKKRQEHIHNLFVMADLPFKRLDVYGSQIVVVCWSKDAADKIAYILQKGSFKIRGIIESFDYNQENKKLLANPSTHKVYKVFACA